MARLTAYNDLIGYHPSQSRSNTLPREIPDLSGTKPGVRDPLATVGSVKKTICAKSNALKFFPLQQEVEYLPSGMEDKDILNKIESEEALGPSTDLE
ncbi:hypothetical protein J6590_086005 [Homalodisca vitripennis]|nr:hypothetical protein J6590_086005 [Homalodisca vitripennis]